MRVVFFGTPPFAATILESLLAHKVDVAAVVTKPDKPKGRSGKLQPPAVKSSVEALAPHIPIHQPERCSTEEFAKTLQSYQADLFIVVAYGEILKQNILDLPSNGCINVHASLLPKYRGAAPIHRAIIEGEKESGVSIMYMVRKMDAGDVLLQKSVPIGPNMTMGELELALRNAGIEALLTVLNQVEQGAVTATPQNEKDVTFAPKIEPQDARIFWGASALEIHNLVRGTSPFPGAWCTMTSKGQDKRLKVLQTQVTEMPSTEPGTIVKDAKGLVIACGTGAIRLLKVKPEGSSAMTGEDLLRGALREESHLK